ncbi:hypothetical protein GCM10010112_23320 [Actinoplanes lobatus]|uniref:DUF1700 domain-containing protein n=1 Tax=Actinoplanes lobatus TaxID=113568 RepID=A0A7W7HIY1_9ACTN|nr:DUF5336 domain-containing protein [Actinoplanes lobatus]MBB4751374.1 hypothetical protein [Actinoplanes lobatus]GGN63771.1 hypothetical protein GCM10010112_23320 [Actinoplanes lobatus]GIE40983.1 hypothetical protein Alo02nite_38810 [Actinoplanes lobatus]
MTSDVLPEAAETYLRALGAELPDAPPDTVREIVDDVRAHIADALAGGRTLEQALAGLGSPQTVAAQAREELALPDRTPDLAARAARLLRAVAVAVGVLTAVYVTFLLPSTLPVDDTEAGTTFMQQYGPGLAMLTLLPALLAAAPSVLPTRRRGPAAAAVAAVLTVFVVVKHDIGLHYVPLMLLLWAAAIVPWAMRRERGRLAVRLWHLTAALLIAFPGLLTGASAGTGKIGLEPAGLVWVLLPLTLAALCAFGRRPGYTATALAGTAVMLMALLDGGFLFAAFWWFGGLYLTIGAIGFVTTPPRPRTRPERPTPAINTAAVPG